MIKHSVKDEKLDWKVRFMGEGRSHQEDAEISCCPGVGTAKAGTFTLSY
jgi:hypothetical protein